MTELPENQRRRLVFLSAYLMEATKLPTSLNSQVNADLELLAEQDNADDINRLAMGVKAIYNKEVS